MNQENKKDKIKENVTAHPTAFPGTSQQRKYRPHLWFNMTWSIYIEKVNGTLVSSLVSSFFVWKRFVCNLIYHISKISGFLRNYSPYVCTWCTYSRSRTCRLVCSSSRGVIGVTTTYCSMLHHEKQEVKRLRTKKSSFTLAFERAESRTAFAPYQIRD